MCLVACFLRMKEPARSASVCEVHWGHRTGDAAVPEGTSEPEGVGGDGGLAQGGRGLIWGDRTWKYFLGLTEECGKGRACK